MQKTCQGEYMSDGQFSHGSRICGGSIQSGNTLALCVFVVDIVNTGSRTPDNFEIFSCVNYLFGDFCSGANKNTVEINNFFYQFSRFIMFANNFQTRIRQDLLSAFTETV